MRKKEKEGKGKLEKSRWDVAQLREAPQQSSQNKRLPLQTFALLPKIANKINQEVKWKQKIIIDNPTTVYSSH